MLKVLLKRHKLFLYIWTCKYYCCYRIYICVKNIAILYGEFTEKNYFLFFNSSIFHSKIKHPVFKMNKNEQGGAGQKFEDLSEHTVWMTSKSFSCNYDLYFNLQSNTFPYHANGFIPFSPIKNIFPNSLINSLNFREWDISIICVKFEMWRSALMWISHLIFSEA